jgi:uncharacterized protein YuzE
MSTDSDRRGRYDSTDGLFVAVQDDKALFGYGTLAARPATGAHDGDIFLVLDQANQIFRLDVWDASNAAWMIHYVKETREPTASDDQSTGVHIGTIWADTTNGPAYVCLDASATVAKWRKLSYGTHRSLSRDTRVTEVSTARDLTVEDGMNLTIEDGAEMVVL